MKKLVTLIPGDGIGPEIVESVKDIFSAAGAPIDWEEINAGQISVDKGGKLIPDELIASLKKNKIGLKGPITTPVGKGFKSINVQLRQLFDLYANIRPCKNIPGLVTKFSNVDLVIVRENTEGLYSGLEFYDERLGISDSIARVTKAGCYQIVKEAFEYAKNNGRKKVTLVHKANILKHAGALFLQAGEEIAKQYPDIQKDEVIIDNMCMQLVVRPEKFDVIVTTNLFGDILSDLCAGLVGGLGIVAGSNIGKEASIFEAVHGSAPDIAGKGIANPTAILKSAVMMLEHMGEQTIAKKIDKALDLTLSVKEQCTGDLGGKASTKEFTKNVIKNL
ncbi:MAG: NAD-dependent isocitrate dehydrogenase [Sporocytophaga sp.]|uniref:isocitrate/isopropylmalate dehydrogenase family protein n=1 Tax=Sporocytophaga sp. TaxID=2231183 RepID=UPI001AFD3851|nr:isocitrate/isopropylmalate family dehydrogenase [Sporocytophaga sp.]MBO9700158.1 NAD-dependent isocitrate dehydrogenase [Sporocytophaga sp.]